MANALPQDVTTPRLATERAEIVLASASAGRLRLLREAGVDCHAEVAGIDEDGVKTSLRAEGAGAAEAAMTLAELKATRISARHHEAFVIGADQILVSGELWFDKPRDLDEARAHLIALRGREHELLSAVCVARGGAAIWRHAERTRLVMRAFSDDFLDRYLEEVGEAALGSVGAYQVEGLGAQLFSHIEGDYFAIIGLPLLALLEFLRGHAVIET